MCQLERCRYVTVTVRFYICACLLTSSNLQVIVIEMVMLLRVLKDCWLNTVLMTKLVLVCYGLYRYC